MARYDLTRFRATHNSYSGGARGSIVEQLNGGVRVIEFDIHARGFAELHDFRLGHLKPGMEVACGDGNPDTLMLADWLAVVARWSDQHVHGPITIVFDCKDDLVSSDCGSLFDLNAKLTAAFGDHLFTRDELDRGAAWPDTADMLNRIVCVLSGDGNTRASYRWAFGTERPAMSINAHGDVVVVYRATSGDLNCFLGGIDDAGAITWQYKTTYCFSRMPLSDPVVSVSDDGEVVASHRFQPPPGFVGSRIERMVGRIGDDRRIDWQDGSRVEFDDARHTAGAAPGADCALFQGTTYRCALDAGGALVCGPAAGARPPLRFPQLAFVEEQKGDQRATFRDAAFFAADAKDKPALAAAAARGQVVRAWGFEETDVPSPAQDAATDDPRSAWYRDYTDAPNVAV